jgi:hypothetical protein
MPPITPIIESPGAPNSPDPYYPRIFKFHLEKALDILRAQTYMLVVSFVKVVCNLSGGNAIG